MSILTPISGLGKVKLFGTKNPEKYFATGTYDVKVVLVRAIPTKKGGAFIAEVEIVNTHGHATAKVGEVKEWFQSIGDMDVAGPDLKRFALAALGYHNKTDADKALIEKEVDPELDDLLAGAIKENLFKGKVLRLNVWAKPTTTGGTFSKHDWSAMP